ncbi:hypothetical protein T11_6255 [Trichinella zimbabwensis]|uniref:Uncharacterized protein n=1 Tax=Trichinella zimbabwensis TaxID=268475 RepID=A0A0V1GNV7_9BILA|nr:hypothetical protein T11_6255 [Trichinella zimbabwensis]
MHPNRLSKLSVQFIAQQRDLHALAGPVLATLIKRSRAELLKTQPCHHGIQQPMPLKRYFTEYNSEYDKNDNSKVSTV